MSKRHHRQRRLIRREQFSMEREQRALMIDELPDKYRKLAKHAGAVLNSDGISESHADRLATSFVMQLVGCAAVTLCADKAS